MWLSGYSHSVNHMCFIWPFPQVLTTCISFLRLYDSYLGFPLPLPYMWIVLCQVLYYSWCLINQLLFSNSFIPLINKPTRVIHNTATIIDYIFRNKYENYNKYMTGILTTDISDHYPIFHITLCHNKPKEENYQLIRLINVSNLEKYKNGIQNHDWTQVNNYNSCQAAFTYFSETIKTIFQDAFPVIRVKKTLQE